MWERNATGKASAIMRPLPGERRRQPRVMLTLHGRYLLADGREHVCSVIDASHGAVALRASERGKIGEKVVVYFDEIGRVEGEVVRYLKYGFVISLMSGSRAADRLAKLVADKYLGAKTGRS